MINEIRISRNVRRGLFRIWIIAALVWLVAACVYSKPLDKIVYAHAYFFDHANLVQAQKAEYLDDCYKLIKKQRTEDYRSLMERYPDWVEIRQKAALKTIEDARVEMERAPLPTDPNQRIAEMMRRYGEHERRMRDGRNETDLRLWHLKKKADVEAIEARHKVAGDECQSKANKNPELPDFDWLALALLPPTIGVSVLALGLWLIFMVGSWIWRGFAQKDGL